MPKGSNKFYAKDKLAVAENVMKILPPEKVYVGDFVADAQRFVFDNDIMPEDQPQGNSVAYIAGEKEDRFARIYFDGRAQQIDKETYVNESIYNFLPDRFKSYKPGG